MSNYMTQRVLHLIRYGDDEGDDEEGGGHSDFGPINITPPPDSPPGMGNENVFAQHPLFAKMPSGIPPKMSTQPSDNPVAEQNALRDHRCEHLLTPGMRQKLTSTPTMTR